MKLTKQQLKQIIKEELGNVLNEAGFGLFDPGSMSMKPSQMTSSPIDSIHKYAQIWPTSDPMGLNFKYTDPKDNETRYDEIKLWDLEPQDLDQLAKRNDLKFFFKREEVDARDFADSLSKYWVLQNQSVARGGQYVVSYLPEWVYKAAGIEPIPEEDPEYEGEEGL